MPSRHGPSAPSPFSADFEPDSVPKSAENAVWPFFGLAVRTPSVELRYPSDDDVFALAELARAGIYEPGEPRWLTAWADLPDDERARSVCQWQWTCRGTLSAADWKLPMAVVVDGEVVGGQDITASNFARLGVVASGSWLGLTHRGRGIGTEMRAAILYFAFAGLGARRAVSSALANNVRSLGVSRRNGYWENGTHFDARGDEVVEVLNVALDRADWEEGRRHDIEIIGLEPCLPMLGIG